MATGQFQYREPRYRQPFRLSRRVVEWSMLAGVIVVLVVLLGHQIRVVQGQAEAAAFKVTLGALRTTLVMHHLQQQLSATGGAGQGVNRGTAQRNPFELLERRPSNYAGEMSAAQALLAPPGSWVFDPVCGCAGYLPLFPQWLSSPSGDPMVWLNFIDQSGPPQLKIRELYVWQGQALD